MGNQHSLLDYIGEPGIYLAMSGAGIDGTATYLAPGPNTLTLAALTGAPTNVQYLGTLVYDNVAGAVKEFPATMFRHSVAAGVLTVENADFSAAGATFIVIYMGQKKGYDSTTDELQVEV